MVSIENVRDALYKSWSPESSSKWTRENPVVKTKCVSSWHFYNKVNICSRRENPFYRRFHKRGFLQQPLS
ncbi:hypothetical protein A4R27_26185 [Priestia endophytica]|nr:hypothetical protein A4R27_26185 [Priestia endophytica]